LTLAAAVLRCGRATAGGRVNTVVAVRHLLSRVTADEVCDACLAATCAISLNAMRMVINRLIDSDRAFHRGSCCATCRRAVPTIFYRVDADSERLPMRGQKRSPASPIRLSS
jgi:hypothetical protein